jgi:hypothetical protein
MSGHAAYRVDKSEREAVGVACHAGHAVRVCSDQRGSELPEPRALGALCRSEATWMAANLRRLRASLQQPGCRIGHSVAILQRRLTDSAY